LAERNLNPKAACLKRREEEKGTEFLAAQAASVYPDHVAAQPLVVRIHRAICATSAIFNMPLTFILEFNRIFPTTIMCTYEATGVRPAAIICSAVWPCISNLVEVVLLLTF